MILAFKTILYFLLCFVCLVLIILILPIRYLINIKICDKKSFMFCISYFFGTIKVQYDNNFKIKILGVKIKPKLKLSINHKKKIDDTKKTKKNNRQEKSKLDYYTLKDFLPSLFEFFFDIVKIIRPNCVKIRGEVGLENPADTGYICAVLSVLSQIFKFDNKIKFNFQNKIYDLNLNIRGKSCALVFVLLVLKYLCREEVLAVIKGV